MPNSPTSFSEKLQQRQQNSSLRKLPQGSGVIDFSANDYLGLVKSEVIFEKVHECLAGRIFCQNGATGSRLLSGNCELYEEAERYLAAFHQAEAALVFNSGYDANLGFFGCLTGREAVVL